MFVCIGDGLPNGICEMEQVFACEVFFADLQEVDALFCEPDGLLDEGFAPIGFGAGVEMAIGDGVVEHCGVPF